MAHPVNVRRPTPSLFRRALGCSLAAILLFALALVAFLFYVKGLITVEPMVALDPSPRAETTLAPSQPPPTCSLFLQITRPSDWQLPVPAEARDPNPRIRPDDPNSIVGFLATDPEHVAEVDQFLKPQGERAPDLVSVQTMHLANQNLPDWEVPVGEPFEMPLGTTTRIDDLPCGLPLFFVASEAEEMGMSNVATTRPGEPPVLRLLVEPAFELEGKVADPDDHPIANAIVHVGPYQTRSAANGDFVLQVPRSHLSSAAPRRSGGITRAQARAEGYRPWQGALYTDPPKDRHAPVNWVPLEPAHEVRVTCLGTTSNACEGVLQCTLPLLPMNTSRSCEPASRLEGPNSTAVRCFCPPGEAVIRGMGRKVPVGPTETEVTLDLRGEATLRGRVLLDARPVSQCTVRANRVPQGLEDLGRGPIVMVNGTCAPDGRFALGGLIEGDWELEISASAEPSGLSQGNPQDTLKPAGTYLARGADHNLGDLELRESGVLVVDCVSALTGDPTDSRLLIQRIDDTVREGPRITRCSRGNARWEGARPGRYEVWPIPTAWEVTEVEIEAGAESRIRIEVGSGTFIAQAGVDLAEDRQGNYHIEAIEPGSPAALAGLQPGDSLIGATYLGVDLHGPEALELLSVLDEAWTPEGLDLHFQAADGQSRTVSLETVD